MAASKPVCKYCLENRETPDNKLFSPCACAGSVGFVHYVCFLKWIFVAPLELKMICPVCKGRYNLDIMASMEIIPAEEPYPLRLISSPLTACILFHYVFFMYGIGTTDPRALATTYWHAQYTYVLVWLFYFVRSVKIKEPLQYFITFVKTPNRFLIASFLISELLLAFNPQYMFLAGLAGNLALGLFWRIHVETLSYMNWDSLTDLAVVASRQLE